jgi:hypothetical protein
MGEPNESTPLKLNPPSDVMPDWAADDCRIGLAAAPA